MPTYTTRTVTSIDDVVAEDWDTLGPINVMCSHGWLRTVEATCNVSLEPAYILAEVSDRLVGAAVCYRMPSTDAILTLDSLLFGRFQKFVNRLGGTFLPAITCRAIDSHGVHILLSDSLAPDHASVLQDLLIDAIESISLSNGTGCAFPYLVDEEASLDRRLKARGYLRTGQFPVNYLDIHWTSFAQYIDDINRGRRRLGRNIRTEIRRALDMGLSVIRIRDSANYEQQLMDLATAHTLRIFNRPFAYRNGFFSTVLRNLGNDARLYGAFKGSKLVGFILMLERGGQAFLPYIGLDGNRSKRDPTYFVLTYHTPIIDAISDNISRIHFGEGFYELKRRRGCAVYQTGLRYRPTTLLNRSVAKAWFRIHSTWMRKKLGEFYE